MERISVYCLDVSIKVRWAISKGRIKGGTSGRQRGFWDRDRHGKIYPGRGKRTEIWDLS